MEILQGKESFQLIQFNFNIDWRRFFLYKLIYTIQSINNAEGAIRTHGPLREWTLNPSPLT